ncbi:MAG: hypothetical protein SH819_05735 [Cytophagales bacterium]|nr:hypothetical protein [Cytophagales bacterium]
MGAHQEILLLRDELKKLQSQTKRSRSRGSFGFGLLVIVTLLSVIFGVVQQMKADQQKELASAVAEKAEAMTKICQDALMLCRSQGGK